MAYVDTNVVLGKYFPEDKLHQRAVRFLEQTAMWKIISPISLVELTAVLSRIDTALRAPEELLKETPRRRVRALLEFLIRDSNLHVASVPAKAKLRVGGTLFAVPIEYHSCIRLAHALKLKTLDLLHVTYADNLRKSGYGIKTFVTFDQDIIGKAHEIQQETEIEVREPNMEEN
jgi:predicted nucleic acid-binding protein